MLNALFMYCRPEENDTHNNTHENIVALRLLTTCTIKCCL